MSMDSADTRRAWDFIAPYSVIVEEARKAQDIGASLTALTHALCAIGLDLSQIALVLAERSDGD